MVKKRESNLTGRLNKNETGLTTNRGSIEMNSLASVQALIKDILGKSASKGSKTKLFKNH